MQASIETRVYSIIRFLPLGVPYVHPDSDRAADACGCLPGYELVNSNNHSHAVIVRWTIDDSIERQINGLGTWNHSDGDEELSHNVERTRTTDPKVWDVRPDNDGILPIHKTPYES